MKEKIMLGILTFLMPMFVYADEISINCPSSVAKNSEFTCVISGKTSGIVTAVSTKVKGNNFDFVSFSTSSGWQGDGNDGNIELYTADDMVNNFDIGTVKFRGTDKSGNVIVDSVVFYDENGKTINVTSLNKTVNINDDSINNDGSTKNDEGNNNDGNNTVVDNNTDNDGTADDSEQDDDSVVENEDKAYLVDLDINNYQLEFNSSVYEYTLEIGEEDKLDIIPIVLDSNYTYEIRNNSGLVNGSVVEVEVVSLLNPDNRTMYTINIVKNEEKKDYSMIFIAIIVVLVIINIVRIVLSVRRRKNEEQV